MKGQGGTEIFRDQDCGVLQHMAAMPPRKEQGNLERPVSPGHEATPRPFLTILGGVSTRMTNRTSQELSPQFCGRIRRLMHTCRFSRDLEVQLAETGEGMQHPGATFSGRSLSRDPTLTPSDFWGAKETKWDGVLTSSPPKLVGHGMPSSKVTCREAKSGGLATHMMQSHDCWYCTPVTVAVTPWMVSDSRWTDDGVEGDRRVSRPTSWSFPPRRGGGLTFTLHGGPGISEELGHQQVQVALGLGVVRVMD